MAINKQLLVLIKKQKIDEMSADNLAAFNKALDELLKEDPAKPEGVRRAMVENKAFWDTIDKNLMGDGRDKEYYTKDDFLDKSLLTEIQQAAAAKRVESGLIEFEKDDLVFILKNNPKECREYLATKSSLAALANAHGWTTASNKVLTDGALNDIKKQAAEPLLLKLIEKPPENANLQVFEGILSKDAGKIKAAVIKLGYPQDAEAVKCIPRVLPESVTKAAIVRKEELELQTTKANFQNFVKELFPATPDILKEIKKLLEQKDNKFVEEFNKIFKKDKILNRDGVWAQEILGAHYLQEVLLTNKYTAAQMTAVLQATNTEKLIQILKRDEFFEDKEYIEKAVEGAGLISLKKSMVLNFINKAEDTILNKLDTYTNISDYRLKLAAAIPGAAFDWMDEATAKDFAKQICSRRLELQVGAASRLGAGAHPVLIAAIKSLPEEEQRIFLKKETLKQDLRYLMSAKTPADVQKYLGNEFTAADSIIIENSIRIELFNAIHNFEVARVLANIKPSISLKPEQIVMINAALDEPGLDLSSFDVYKELINKIEELCGAKKDDYLVAFGIDNDEFKKDHKVPSEINKYYLNSIFRATKEELKSLDSVKDVADFRKELVKIMKLTDPTALAWIQDQDMIELTQEINSHRFEMHVDAASYLGKGTRPELLAELKGLPIEKQRELLKKPAEDLEQDLHHLMNAKDERTVKHYLGREFKNADKIIKENDSIREAGFKKIHNAAVAKVLANITPAIRLSQNAINKINAALAENQDLSQENQYKGLIKKIEDACNVNEGEYYDAFGVGTIYEEVAKQCNNNINILAEYVKPNSLIPKALLDVFLRIEKQFQIQDGDKGIGAIQNAYHGNDNVDQFIDTIIPENGAKTNPDLRAIKTQLTRELTAAEFDRMKSENRRAKFLIKDAAAVEQAVNKVFEEIDKLTEYEISGKFKFIEKIKPASYLGKPKEEAQKIKAIYQELSGDCDLIVEDLRSNRSVLKGHLNNLPELSELKTKDDKAKERVEELRNALTEELNKVEENIKYYEAVQWKLSGSDGILDALDVAISGKKEFVYEAINIKSTTCKREDKFKDLPSSGKVEEVIVRPTDDNKKISELFKDKPAAGEVRRYDVVNHPWNDDRTKQVKVVGTIVYDSGSEPAGSQKGSTPSSGQIEIKFANKSIKYPVDPPRVGERAQPAETVKPHIIEKTNMQTAMEAAVKYIEIWGPPTKENPAQIETLDDTYAANLWAAFKILGENHPKQKFGSDAIKIVGSSYRPENDKTLGRFNDDSPYKKFTVEHKGITDQAIKEMKEHAQLKYGNKDTKALDEKAQKQVSFFKEALKDTKEKIEEKTKKHGWEPPEERPEPKIEL